MVAHDTDSSLIDEVDLALLMGDHDSIDAVVGAFVLVGRDRRVLVPSELRVGEFPASEDVIRQVFEFLITRGYATEVKNPTWGIEPSFEKCVELLYGARRAQRIIDRSRDKLSEGSFELTCTLPDNDPSFDGMAPLDFGMNQITSKLLNLCGEAEDTLLLVSPYLEASGVAWLLPGIKGALKRGVSVSIVSRELEPGTPNFSALDSLFDVARNSDGNVTVYDYFEPKSDSNVPLYTLHSKLLLVDRTKAYLGSANFTKYGFSENLEVGVILRGGSVSELEHLVRYVIENSATEVFSQ